MRAVTCRVRQYSDGDPENAFASGPTGVEWSGTWASSGGVQEGELDSGSGTTLRIPKPDSTRRQVFAIQAAGTSIKRGNDPAFGWAGGTPTTTLDLDDYDEPPTSAALATSIKILNLWVTTDKLQATDMTIANPTSGRWYYFEGEPEATFRTWDPTA